MNDIKFLVGLGVSMLALYGVALVVDMLDIGGWITDAVRRYRGQESRS